METCGICLGAMQRSTNGRALYTAECSHVFHFTCITSHAHHKCPTCGSHWLNPLTSNPYPNPYPYPYPYIHARHQVQVDSIESYADDEPLPTPAPDSVTSASSSETSDAKMTVKALPEYPALSKAAQSKFAVLIGIQAPPLSPEASDKANDRAPIDLVAVLDVSGSMSGQKIMLLKQAVGFVATNLGPTDRLSIITFSTYAGRKTPLRRMTDTGRVNTIHDVNSLIAEGSTDIIAGLKMAVQVLEQRRQKNPVASIILLSDGQDNQNGYGQEFLQSLRSLPPCIRSKDTGSINQTDAIPVHTFGFGSDHDATALHAIAEGSRGTFSFIENIGVIQDAFAQCLGGLLSVVSQQTEIQVGCTNSHVQIESITSGSYQNSVGCSKHHGVIHVGDMYAEEEKKFLVYLSVPPAPIDTLTTQLMEVKCSYRDPLSKQSFLSDIVKVEIKRLAAEELSDSDKQVCLEVDREKNRVLVAEGIAKAKAIADRGELREARLCINQQRKRVMESSGYAEGDAYCQGLHGELKFVEDMMNINDYGAGGMAYTNSRLTSHGLQRQAGVAMKQSARRSTGGAAPPGGIAYGGMPPAGGICYGTSAMNQMVKKSRTIRESTMAEEKTKQGGAQK